MADSEGASDRPRRDVSGFESPFWPEANRFVGSAERWALGGVGVDGRLSAGDGGDVAVPASVAAEGVLQGHTGRGGDVAEDEVNFTLY